MFSNGTGWEIWSSNYCDVCKHDAKFRETQENGCELILQLLIGETPKEFTRSGPHLSDITCSRFEEE